MIRAFQWDLARQVERLDWLLAQLPRYASWGYQQLYLHLEDAVHYPSLPEVARSDAYTYAQLGKLVEAAHKVGIGVVPIVNLLGHTQYLIKVPSLRDLNELRAADGSPLEKGQICPLHPRTLEIADKLLSDIAPFCTAGRVHVGLDESFHLGKHPLSKAEISKIGLAAHFANYVQRLHALTEKKGLKLGMWADMLVMIPEAMEQLPKGIAAYDWYYYPFRRKPRFELYNFLEYDLEPALRKRGIEYWGCPMNGAFRYEPLPIFSDRLDNIRSWWKRCQRVQAEGFLITSWEPYRLDMELTKTIDAAAANLWLAPNRARTNPVMLADGFQRALYSGPKHNPQAIARAALEADKYPFSGYSRWESLDRWDTVAMLGGGKRLAAESRSLAGLAKSDLPAPLRDSLKYRVFLSLRENFLRVSMGHLRSLRSHLRTCDKHLALLSAKALLAEAERFEPELKHARGFARQMWRRTRSLRSKSHNEALLNADRARLKMWMRWVKTVIKNPLRSKDSNLLCGAWQLCFTVVTLRPTIQRVVVEQQDSAGVWRLLHGRYIIEFQSGTARPKTRLVRPFSTPVFDLSLPFRIGLRGLGQVLIRDVILTDGSVSMQPEEGRFGRPGRLLGDLTPRAGFPHWNSSENRDELIVSFLPESLPPRQSGRRHARR